MTTPDPSMCEVLYMICNNQSLIYVQQIPNGPLSGDIAIFMHNTTYTTKYGIWKWHVTHMAALGIKLMMFPCHCAEIAFYVLPVVPSLPTRPHSHLQVAFYLLPVVSSLPTRPHSHLQVAFYSLPVAQSLPTRPHSHLQIAFYLLPVALSSNCINCVHIYIIT